MALAMLAAAAATTTTGIAIAATSSSGSSLKTSDDRARYGRHVHLRGSVPDAPNATVRITFRRAGHRAWHTVRHARTDANGAFSARVRARASGAYRARHTTQPSDPSLVQSSGASDPSGGATEPARVRVVSRLRARARNHAVIGRRVRIRGRVKPGNAHRLVRVKVDGDTLRARTDHRGRFRVAWHPARTGRTKVSVHASGDPLAAGSRDRAGHVTVFRRAVASYYGPGFYGSRTACGQTLEPSTLGVANRTLACGTKVVLRYHGRQVKVPVIDRGPYAAGRDFDLTAATKQRLGFPSTGTLLSSK
jgi:hypothetical protein